MTVYEQTKLIHKQIAKLTLLRDNNDKIPTVQYFQLNNKIRLLQHQLRQLSQQHGLKQTFCQYSSLRLV